MLGFWWLLWGQLLHFCLVTFGASNLWCYLQTCGAISVTFGDTFGAIPVTHLVPFWWHIWCQFGDTFDAILVTHNGAISVHFDWWTIGIKTWWCNFVTIILNSFYVWIIPRDFLSVKTFYLLHDQIQIQSDHSDQYLSDTSSYEGTPSFCTSDIFIIRFQSLVY